MTRLLVDLDLETLAQLPGACRRCVFWECAAGADAPAGGDASADLTAVDPAFDKEAWLSRVLLEWGTCGKLAQVGDATVGYVLYAPPGYLPGARVFPTGPVSADAVLLAAVRVLPAHAGAGLGRLLLRAAAHDVAARGIRAVETFGDTTAGVAGGMDRTAAGVAGGMDRTAAGFCTAPAGFFLAAGFQTVAWHPRFPRLRLELRTHAEWTTGAGYALPEWTPWDTAGDQLASLARSSRTSMVPVSTSDSTG